MVFKSFNLSLVDSINSFSFFNYWRITSSISSNISLTRFPVFADTSKYFSFSKVASSSPFSFVTFLNRLGVTLHSRGLSCCRRAAQVLLDVPWTVSATSWHFPAKFLWWHQRQRPRIAHSSNKWGSNCDTFLALLYPTSVIYTPGHFSWHLAR